MKRRRERFVRFDVADHLTDVESAAAYLEAVALESANDPSAIAQALGDIARSGNMSELARRAGMTREGLYKSLSESGNPSFATVSKVAAALGLELRFAAAH
ncbi:MAG: putative addiction module antidote protein [Promicromonosporaceae bacterium]|nr:putative addiction module antidote protein [Promicromonosporaceae bacterium]